MKPVIYTSIESEPEDVYTNQLQYDYSNNNITCCGVKVTNNPYF